MDGASIDDRELARLRYSPVCSRCRHFRGESELTGAPVCAAFPLLIPPAIWEGHDPHTGPHPGDHGIRFARAEPPAGA